MVEVSKYQLADCNYMQLHTLEIEMYLSEFTIEID